MGYYRFIQWGDDSTPTQKVSIALHASIRKRNRRNRHLLDREPIGVLGILFPYLNRYGVGCLTAFRKIGRATYLRCIIEVLLCLNRPQTRLGKRVDLVNPLAATSANISGNHQTQRCAVHLGEWVSVHLPCQKHLLVRPDFSVWHRHGIVEHVAFPASYQNKRQTAQRDTDLKYVSAPMNSRC